MEEEAKIIKIRLAWSDEAGVRSDIQRGMVGMIDKVKQFMEDLNEEKVDMLINNKQKLLGK